MSFSVAGSLVTMIFLQSGALHAVPASQRAYDEKLCVIRLSGDSESTGLSRLIREGVLKFDVFGSRDLSAEALVKFLDRHLAGTTGYGYRDSEAALVWFEHLYQTYLGCPAPQLGLWLMDASITKDTQKRRMISAYAKFLRDLHAGLATHPLTAARGLSIFDIFGPRLTDPLNVVKLLSLNLSSLTDLSRLDENAATAWFAYLYETYLGRPSPDFRLPPRAALLTREIDRLRLSAAWWKFVTDLRQALNESLHVDVTLPAPSAPLPQIEPVVAKPAERPRRSNVIPLAEYFAGFLKPSAEPAQKTVPQRISPMTDAEKYQRATMKTILNMELDPRTIVIFLSERYRKTIRLTDTQALDRLLNQVFADFAPGYQRQPRRFPPNAATRVHNRNAGEIILSPLREVWLELRRQIQRQESLKTLTATTEAL